MDAAALKQLLSRKTARQFSLKNNGWKTVFHELSIWNDSVTSFLMRTVGNEERLQRAVSSALGKTPQERIVSGRLWGLFLKNRKEALNWWTGLIGLFTSVFALGYTLFILAAETLGQPKPISILAIVVALTAAFLMLKYELDLRSSWYAQLANHIDRAVKESELQQASQAKNSAST